jgi:hypothetical protein
MSNITKETSAGVAIIEVGYAGCGWLIARLNGAEIGRGMVPLSPAREINGKVCVSRCGKLALTAEDVAQIEAAIATEQVAYECSAEGLQARERMAKDDRIAESNERKARANDINKWRDA